MIHHVKHAIWIVSLAVLLMSGSADAADVKFSGQYTYEGWYENNHSLLGENAAPLNPPPSTGFQTGGLILDTQFKVAEGVTLNTRARILNKIWGDGASGAASDVRDRTYATNRYLRENIEFERLFIVFRALGGRFDIGQQLTNQTGTVFSNTDEERPIIKYTYTAKPWSGYIAFQKTQERELVNPAALTYGTGSDVDYDQWKYGISFSWKTGVAGMGGTFYNNRLNRNDTASSYTAVYHKLNPYVKATIGQVYLEGESNVFVGGYRSYEQPDGITRIDSKRNGWNIYGKVRYTFGPAYVGAQYAFVSGDDAGTADRYEAGPSSGREYKPCLILLNSDRDKWLGALGTGGIMQDNYAQLGSVNFQFYQGFVGYKPLPKLELTASYSRASLDKQNAYVDDFLGSELDLTATYKLYDNLTYLVGYGYLWTGDAWKGTNAGTALADDWLLMHRLTLTF